MSKHKERQARRAAYHNMLDAELVQEGTFVDRVIDTLDNEGLDVAPDGLPIKADFRRYIHSRLATDLNTARAGLSLLEKAVNSLRVRRVGRYNGI